MAFDIHFMDKSRLYRKLRQICGWLLTTLVLGTGVLVLDGLRDRTGTAEVALVLGSKVELDGRPSARLQARLDKTLELYRAGCFPWVIASGGVGKEGYDEAAVMRDYLVAGGIPADRVILDSAGNTTWLSALNTAGILQQRKMSQVLVVSQYFHLPRARLALQRFGVKTVYSGHPDFFEWRDLYSAPREFLGYLSYLFRRYDNKGA
jgi:hypothetical protein